MAEYKWIITKDHLDKEGTDRGRVGVGNVTIHESLPFYFRLYDDDGVLYYAGRTNDITSQSAFIPLDWAMGDAGCTEIQVSEDGKKYETL